MKLASFHSEGRDRIGLVLSNGNVIDAAGALPEQERVLLATEPVDVAAVVRTGEPLLARLRDVLASAESSKGEFREFGPADIAWHPPLRRPSKIVCIALNNRAMDAMKLRGPTDHPAFFIKPSTSLVGHNAPIVLRPWYGLTHPEAELAVVIGKELSRVPPETALQGVFGYTIMNDVTSVWMRDEDSFTFKYFRQDPKTGALAPSEAHTTYAGRYKGSDTFGPCGPYVVTQDEVPNPHELEIQCRVGGKLITSDTTSNYVWSVPAAISHISRSVTLLPGDIVSMGTATAANERAAAHNVPGVFKADLQQCDGVVSISISRIGTLSNPIRKLP